MSPTHTHTRILQPLGSPFSPLPPSPSRPESFGPLSQYHNSPAAEAAQQTHLQRQPTTVSQQEEAIVSPLDTSWPDSPTLGHLSPVSILSPKEFFPLEPEPLRFNHTTPETHNIAPGGTVHLQDHLPFKPASTRFPARKPLTHSQLPATTAAAEYRQEQEQRREGETGPTRPITLYLADHHPHLVAPSPTAPITRSHYINGLSYHEGRSTDEVDRRARSEDVEMQEVELRSPRGFSSADYGGLGARRPEEGVGGRDGGEGGGKGKGKGDGEWKVRTKYEMKRRKQNCLIGWAFLVALVGLSAVFALLAIQANKPGGVAG